MPFQPAILGTARINNFRLGYRPAALTVIRQTRSRITLAGVAGRVRRDGLVVHDVINDNPDTCELVVDSPEPTGQQSLRVSINSDAPRLLFNGALQKVDLSYEGEPPVPVWPCDAIDDQAQANRRRPFGTWTDVSATTIALAILAASAPGFSTAGIEASLPLVSLNLDGSEGINGAFQQLAKLIGGAFKFEDGIAYLFTEDVSDAPDDIDETPGRFLDDPPIKISTDDAQLLNRAFGKGHGETTLSDVAAAESIVPISDASWYEPAGGKVISDTQRINYTGLILGGVGSLVGPGVAPSAPPTIHPIVGAGIDDGVHAWTYLWHTAAGDTLISPPATATMETLPSAPAIAAVTPVTGVGGPDAGITVTYGIAILKSLAEFSVNQLNSGASDLVTAAPVVAAGPGTNYRIDVVVTAGMVGRVLALFRADTGGGGNTSYSFINYQLCSLGVGATLSMTDNGLYNTSNNFYGFYGSPAGWTGFTHVNQAQVRGIAFGPTGTTQRKVFRTAAGGTQPKLQQTIANNTTTVGVTDATADGSLGANAPVADASGLVTATGQINAGSPTLLTAGWPFDQAGWVFLGQQLVRYTGITGNTLTGIPPTGIGALVNTVKYGEHVDVAPALTGVTGIVVPLLKGAPVNIWVQRDDLAAQADQAVIDAANGVSPADGIYEGPPIVDERRNQASIIALCDATLAQRSRPIVTVTYACRDPKTKSGKMVHIDVPSLGIGPIDLLIQSVDITEIDISDGLNPRFSVVASSMRSSLDALLRQLLAAAA